MHANIKIKNRKCIGLIICAIFQQEIVMPNYFVTHVKPLNGKLFQQIKPHNDTLIGQSCYILENVM